MKVVAWHTPDYSADAELFKASCKACGVNPYIHQSLNNMEWDKAVSYKPEFIRDCIQMFGPILYVDIDAVLHEDPIPELLDLMVGYDFGAHWFQGPCMNYERRNDDWFLSGTMVWMDTVGAKRLLVDWLELNAKKQAQGVFDGGGQANLREILDSPPCRVKRLPGRFCRVFDKPWAYDDDEPNYIEHTIASRENRGPNKGYVNKGRRVAVQELRAKYLGESKNWKKRGQKREDD